MTHGHLSMLSSHRRTTPSIMFPIILPQVFLRLPSSRVLPRLVLCVDSPIGILVHCGDVVSFMTTPRIWSTITWCLPLTEPMSSSLPSVIWSMQPFICLPTHRQSDVSTNMQPMLCCRVSISRWQVSFLAVTVTTAAISRHSSTARHVIPIT